MPGTMIVDDTPLIRSSLIRILSGQGLAPDPLVEASNGEEAVQLARSLRPEIVFMDIRMPGLDGLQATAIIRSEVPEARVVMLTAYDEFSYAQKALKMGVRDYLLKPVRPDKLLETVGEITAEIEQERARLEATPPCPEVSKPHSVVETNFVENLIRGTMPDSETVGETLGYLQRELLWPAVLVIKPDSWAGYHGDNGADAARVLYKQMAAITALLLPEPGRSLVGYSSPGRIIAIVSSDGALETVKARRSLASEIRRQVRRETSLTVTVGLGERYPALASIPLSYAEANLARRASRAAGGNVVVHIGDLETATCPGPLVMNPVQVECDLVRAVQEEQPQLARQLLERVLDSLARRHQQQLLPWQNHCAELMALVAWGVVGARVPAPRVLGVLHAQVKGLAGAQDVNEVRSWALNSLAELLSMIEGVAQPEDPVEAALAYVRQEFRRADLSLNEVADVVSLSPSHLSSLFKEQTGQTYIRTLTSLRVAHACHLLRTTDHNVADVARAAGYRHTTNFYRHFQRETGMTPGEYREQPSQGLKN